MNHDAFKKRRNVPEGPEPEGEVKGTQDSLVFVVQKHQASHLHYDFRLELDGVLKSWAVPKGPSLNPKEKRLAIMVEDHPLEYRTQEQVRKELNQGELRFLLFGEKLRGEFVLIRQKRLGEKAWLLIKKRDRYASDADITLQDRSVISGKRLGEVRATKPA